MNVHSDFDETWASNSVVSNIGSVGEWSLGLDNGSDCETLGESSAEWEVSLEGGGLAALLNVGDWSHDWGVLAADVGQVVVRAGEIRERRRELESGVLCGWGRVAGEREGLEGWNGSGDGRDVAGCLTRVWNNEELVDGIEGKGTDGSGEERCRGWDLLLDDSVSTVLLCLFTDDGADETDESGSTVSGKGRLSALESTEDEVGEGRGESDSGLEVRGWELVVARTDGLLASAGEDGIGSDSVELLLCSDGLERLNDVVLCHATKVGESVGAGLDLVEEGAEIGNLKQLVGGNDLQGESCIIWERARQRRVWECATSLLLDLHQVGRAWVWESIWQREWGCDGGCHECGEESD